MRPTKDGGTRVVRVNTRDDGRPARWCEVAEERFLAELAATCNVKASVATTGFSPNVVYQRRRKYPAFAAAWDEAIATGYARLEARLVELATDSLRAPVAKDDTDIEAEPEVIGPRMTVAETIHVLRLHRSAVKGEGGPQRWRRAAPDADAMRASILRKVEAIRRARALPEPREADAHKGAGEVAGGTGPVDPA